MMVRKQIYIEAAQDAFLKRRAKESGMSEAELIRRAILQLRHAPTSTAFDQDAWHEVLAFFDKRARLAASGAPVAWRREDAYEERLALISGLHQHPRMCR
jgi:hypothetical protein